MKTLISSVFLLLPLAAFGQNAEPPRFLAADVHVAARTQVQGMRTSTRGERYELKNATMVDLIVLAYSSNPIKVLGGPSWLEMDRFDVIAKQPPQTPQDSQRLMVRSLLAERFKLVIREDSKPLPTYALTMGKKSQLKEADGSGDTGCKAQSTASAAPGTPGDGVIRVVLGNPNGGAPVQLSLANGMIEYKCRNMTMAAFADGLRGMINTNLGVNSVIEQTGLSGIWNFDFRYSLGFILPGAPSPERLTISDAIEKQLGLKLEERQIPTPVLVVESVNRKPVENPPGTAEAIPPIAAPAEFEVASIKASSPDSRGGRFQMQPGGRLNSEGMPLRFLITRAFNIISSDQLMGVPAFADTTRFDLIAKAPADSVAPVGIDQDALAPMMLSLLKDRFKLSYHTEERELPAYTLVAVKPKLKKADPSARSWCKSPSQIPGAPPAPQGSNVMICQNITMTQFADLLRNRTPDLQTAVTDSTGIEGGWDFTLTFNPVAGLQAAVAAARPPDAGPGNPAPAASEPSAGYSIYEAMEKELGLKLEKQKRATQVIVIDHIEQTPTPD
jgi:uncharacterized protein (TIGR03435 family)